jgi:hypothetical protein
VVKTAPKWRISKDYGTWYVYHPSGLPWARFPEWARAIRFVEQWARS